VSAEQVADVRVGDARGVDVDLTDGEIVQLVLDLRNHLTVMTLYVDAIRDGLAHCPADRLSELQRSAELAVRRSTHCSSTDGSRRPWHARSPI
jgi:hypothetical protein